MTNTSPRAVIFDLDGTLYPMRWYMKPLMFTLLIRHGLRLPAYMKVRKVVAGKDFETGPRLMDALCHELATRTRGTPEAMREWVERKFYPAFVRMMPMLAGRRDSLPDTLARLREKGVRLAVLSDFACVSERLVGLGLKHSLFDIVASSEEAGALKPHPRPFLDIASHFSLDPSEILVIGDRDDTDGAAAAACGMSFLRISDKPSLPDSCLHWAAVRERLESIS